MLPRSYRGRGEGKITVAVAREEWDTSRCKLN